MKTTTSLILVLLLGFVPFLPVSANNISASDLRFVSQGGSKYQIVLKLYRYCKADSFRYFSDSLFWFAGNNGNAATSLVSLKLTRISITDVSLFCPRGTAPCSPGNTPVSKEGIEEHVYICNIDLSDNQFAAAGLGTTNCEFNVAFHQCCRTASITSGPALSEFWTKASLNICNLNQCAKMVNTCAVSADLPAKTLFCNMGFYSNIGFMDTTDFDSLAFRLAEPLAAINTGVSFTSPYSYRYPVTPYCVPNGIKCTPTVKTDPPRGFYFDSLAGDMIFTPVKCDEVAVLSVEVKEWRKNTTGKYVVISTTRREYEFRVTDSNGYNKPPVISGPSVNQVCEGDKICFDINTQDPAFTPYQIIPDTIEMHWNKGIPGASFTVTNPASREKTAQFCWQTRLGQASDVPYGFTVTATDNFCPKPASSVRGFKIKVNPRAFDQRKYTCYDTMIVASATLSGGFKGLASYKWSFRDSAGINAFYSGTGKTDTARIAKTGRYIVVHTVNNSDNCPTSYSDTVTCIAAGTVYPVQEIPFIQNPVKPGDILLEKYPVTHAWWIDAAGRIAARSNGNAAGLTVPRLPAGVYFLKIETPAAKPWTGRIVIQE